MAPFPYVAILAIMACLVSSMVVEMSVYAYAGYMVEHLGVVDDKDEAGDKRKRDDVCLNLLYSKIYLLLNGNRSIRKECSLLQECMRRRSDSGCFELGSESPYWRFCFLVGVLCCALPKNMARNGGLLRCAKAYN